MKKLIEILCLSFLVSIQPLFGQGIEGFDNFNAGSDVVSSGSFKGNNNITWNYTNCRGDSDRQASYSTTYTDNKCKSVATQFSQNGCIISQTNEYVAPPDTSYNITTKEWHLKASYGSSSKNRVLTIIQVIPDSMVPAEVVKLGDGDFQCSDWRVTAELNSNNPARLYIRNDKQNVSFSLGDDNPIINSIPYQRLQSGSSVLYDEINGVKQVVEISDRPVQATR